MFFRRTFFLRTTAFLGTTALASVSTFSFGHICTPTDLAVFFDQRLPVPSHPDRRSTTLTHGRALTDDDDALLPLPRLLPDHPAWEVEEEGEVAEVAAAGWGDY